MAEIDFILQAVTTSTHADAIRALLSIPIPNQVLISVAFVREAGLDALEEAIKPVAEQATFFVGVRNDITSIQAIKRLLAMKVVLYAVDTGSRNTIFHPKLYFAANNEEAGVIIGSANLTFGGLHNNIEASSFMRLCLSNPTDKKFVDDATLAFADMLKEHPRHVFLIKDKTHAEELFESGRLADENVIPAPSVQSGVKKGERDDLPPMKLNRRNRPHLKTTVIKPVVIRAKPAIEETTIEVDQLRPAIATAKYLVWESKELTERDLNIPKAPDTNPTVSMGWKKGAFDDIDQRHYFREEVFSDLDWVTDPNRPIWERAQAKFDLVIKNLNYGAFDLKLSHNTDQTSKSYAQKNFMTQLHWGDAKEHVAKHDLLGRILYLYRKDTNPPEFTIEID